MKTLLTITFIIALGLPAVAFDLGSRAPDKSFASHDPGAPDPEFLRQGGDTIADAVAVDLPVVDLAGTTAGYTDDYDEVCPYTGSVAPDVVYSFVPAADQNLTIDMLGSTYDTKIYVYDEDLGLVACNDDFYPDYVSKIENMPVVGGALYYLVIDGWGGDAGNYVLNVAGYDPCVLECPAGAELEGEPPLEDDYVDTYNGGCGTGGWLYWDSMILCGVTGWYQSGGSDFRDTDWMEIPFGPDGMIEIEGDAELPTYMFELGPQDCAAVGVIQNVTIGTCSPASMTIVGEAGTTVWFWVGPTTFSGPGGPGVYEYDYVLLNNTSVIAVEEHSWTDVKALFD